MALYSWLQPRKYSTPWNRTPSLSSFLHTPAQPTIVSALSFTLQPALPPPRSRHLPPTVAAAGGERQGRGWCSAGGVLCWQGSLLAGFSAGGVLCWRGSLLAGFSAGGVLCWWGVVRWGGRGTGTGGVVGSTGGATGLDGVQGADRERFGASSGVEATSPAAPNTPATSATPFTAAAKSTGGRAGKRCDWRMLALAAATPFPLSSSPPLRPSLFLRHGAATRQRDGGGSIGRLARGPVGGFVGGRAHTRAGGFVGGLAGALVGGSDGGSVGGFASGSVGRLAGALVGGTDSGSVGGFAGGSVPGVPGAFMACAVACVAGSERATG
ncbi:unnamed protein product [Closterium sp. NIES-64]|nr:unnamed protein product [Closterium sp. NIES-64]